MIERWRSYGGAALALLTLTLILGAAAGCSAIAARLATPTPTNTPLPIPSPTHTPTATTTHTATATPTATSTITPTPTTTPTITPTPSPTWAPLHARVRLEEPQIAQGLVGVVRVEANRPCSVSGLLDGRAIVFGSQDGLNHVALIGVHAMAKPGLQELEVVVRSEEGAQVGLATTLTVLAREFAQENLTFSPEVSRLLDPQYTEPELKRMQAVYAIASPIRHWQGTFRWPHKGTITSPFGARRNYAGRLLAYHAGLDIDGETGDQVVAAADGVVVLAEPLQVRGNAVVLDHGWGVLSGYYHLDTIAVSLGDRVAAGDPLGTLGASGLVTGSHLHWELHVGGIAVDPRQWLEREFPGS
ncbi:MAG: M23 family metallopeptidase [Chloroflexi bacterium]|nr:M23 family metallopeptidase [Chloroflexota bacterium]